MLLFLSADLHVLLFLVICLDKKMGDMREFDSVGGQARKKVMFILYKIAFSPLDIAAYITKNTSFILWIKSSSLEFFNALLWGRTWICFIWQNLSLSPHAQTVMDTQTLINASFLLIHGGQITDSLIKKSCNILLFHVWVPSSHSYPT